MEFQTGIYSFGDNSEKNLGILNDIELSKIPIPQLLKTPIRFVKIATGLYHSLAITSIECFKKYFNYCVKVMDMYGVGVDLKMVDWV